MSANRSDSRECAPNRTYEMYTLNAQLMWSKNVPNLMKAYCLPTVSTVCSHLCVQRRKAYNRLINTPIMRYTAYAVNTVNSEVHLQNNTPYEQFELLETYSSPYSDFRSDSNSRLISSRNRKASRFG